MAFTDDFYNASYPQTLDVRSGWSRVDGTAGDCYLGTGYPGTLSVTGASESAYQCTSQSSADHYTQAEMRFTGSSFVCVRLTNKDNFIGFRHDGGNWQVYKRVAGAFTQLGSNYAAALTPGDVAKLSATGNTLVFTVNGTQRCLGTGVTETFNNTEARQGVVARALGINPWIDNFEAGVTGGGGTNATAPGASVTGTGTVSAGSASGGSGATGSFTFAACENNTHAGILNNIAVNWTWLGGTVGAVTSITNGSGTMTTAGMTISGLPTGVGCGLVRTADGTVVAYQEGTVT
mgnify:CR=1 FL=1